MDLPRCVKRILNGGLKRFTNYTEGFLRGSTHKAPTPAAAPTNMSCVRSVVESLALVIRFCVAPRAESCAEAQAPACWPGWHGSQSGTKALWPFDGFSGRAAAACKLILFVEDQPANRP